MVKTLQYEQNYNVQSDLEELVAGVEDATDPSSMDKVLDYYEKILEEDDDFIELLTQKLKNEIVYWEQPWYQRENRLSRPHNEIGENEDTLRTDSICKDEHDLIARNWRKFRKKYGIPDTIICLARWKNKYKSRNPRVCLEEQARRFATAYLARGLKRNTYQIFQHIMAFYGGYRKGYYSAVEEKIMEICFYHKPRLVGRIVSRVLGREPRGVYKRLEQMLSGKPVERKKLKWTLPLASKFLQLLLKYTSLELEELKNKRFERDVWLKLEEDMNQNYSYLQHFWYCYLHVQLFVRCDIKLNKLKKRLFKKLRASSYKVWTDIRWKDVIIDFPDGFTPRFIYKICYLTVMTLKGYLRAPLAQVIDYALQKIKKNKHKRNKRLKTLKLNKDGQLELVDYRT